MRLLTLPVFPVAAASLLLALPASAQFGNEWVGFENDDARLSAALAIGLDDDDEKDYAWADLDQDGWTDLVCVRKQPFTSTGRRRNVLFMNEGGVLVDRTTTYANTSDVAGDVGMMTFTNDRDVVITDVDGDGWLDVVTATTNSPGQSKAISHPRVYINLGESGGVWQGLFHEDARIPTLVGAQFPNFGAVDAGDVTGDGFPDLYFADTNANNSTGDLNDRLLINDGNGFFTDGSSAMTAQMLNSAFGASADIEDMNGDGTNDIVKDSGFGGGCRVSYNDPGNVGMFNLTHLVSVSSPYYASAGDLNNDDRLDLLISTNGADRVAYNTGNSGSGLVNWSATVPFQFLSGSDDGFGSNNLVIDLDDDGWNDALVADVDIDLSGCTRRGHIYHNPGGNPGDLIQLVEEAEMSGSSGWKGVAGITANDMRGTHDFAVFDIDNDGDKDMIIGTCTGTSVWMSTLNSDLGTSYCVAAANSNGPGASIYLQGSASVGAEDLTMNADGASSTQPGVFFFGTNQVQNPFGDGFLCTNQNIERVWPPDFTDGSGSVSRTIGWGAPYAGSLNAGSTVNFQFWFRDPGFGPAGFNLSDAISLDLVP